MSPTPIETSPPVLDYIPLISRHRLLSLELGSGTVRVMFPVSPMWACVLPIVLYAAAGLMKAAMGLWFVLTMHSLSHQFHMPTASQPFFFQRRFEAEILLSTGFSALLWWGVAGFLFWQLYRWGRVPRVLEANSMRLVFSWLGWWRMRERRWPAAEISGIELRPVRGNLNWARTVADVFILSKNGRRHRFRLSSADPRLPNQIATELSLVLGCPLA